MKPTALLLICGIVVCLLVVIFIPETKDGSTPAAKPASSNPPASHDHEGDSHSHGLESSEMPTGSVDELKIIDHIVGEGAEALPGKSLTVHYSGWLYDTSKEDKKGKPFDSSVGKSPFSFGLGRGEVIPGWDIGMEGMKIGGKRTLIIPGFKAYGPAGRPPLIPSNATLIFDVELINVK